MKTLIILRHSKTEKIYPAGDQARELTKPGRRWATEAGREIFEAAGMPDLLVTSNAIRALQTGDLAAEAMQFTGERRVVPDVYGATENELVEVILFASNPIVPIGIEPMMINHPSRAALRGEESRMPRSQSRFPCTKPSVMDTMSPMK